MKKGERQTALHRPGAVGGLSLRHSSGRGALLRLVPAVLAILTAVTLPSPAVCGDNPPSVTESSATYKNPVCNFIVKNLETEIAETTASLKNCPPAGQAGGDKSSTSAKASAAKAKECAQYERKLELTKDNLFRVREQCDKGLTPDYLPKVIENPDAVPCAQCGVNKSLPQDPPAKVLTGFLISGQVMDLKAGDPVLAAVAGKSATPAAIGAPPEPRQEVLCICANGLNLGWMLLSECQSSAVQSRCGAVVPPPTVQPSTPTAQPSTPAVQPPAKGSAFLAKAGNFFKAIGKWIWDNLLKPIVDFFAGIYHKIKGDTEKCDGKQACTGIGINGPADLILSKPYTNSPVVSLQAAINCPCPVKIRWSSSSDKIKFTGPTDQPTVRIIPISESKSEGDVTVSVDVDGNSVEKKLTVRRPASIEHEPLKFSRYIKNVLILIPVPVVGTAGHFIWTLKDQFSKPLGGTSVSEILRCDSNLSSVDCYEAGFFSPFTPRPQSAITDSNGEMHDIYAISVILLPKTFKLVVHQDLGSQGYTGRSDVVITESSIVGTSPVELK
ncbi:MAG: hypothetical protein Q8O90_00535 [Elusimicrobiota bacterium]|nr:hypothetical protein [Elusimicrobiota bacterium]